jgi:CheY-like chemotaxis protein
MKSLDLLLLFAIPTLGRPATQIEHAKNSVTFSALSIRDNWPRLGPGANEMSGASERSWRRFESGKPFAC